MRTYFYLVFFVLILTCVSFSQTSTQTFTTIEGFPVEVQFKLDKDTILLGEPTFVVLDVKTSQNFCHPVCDFFKNISDMSQSKITLIRDDSESVPPTTFFSYSSIFSGCFNSRELPDQQNLHYTKKIYLTSPHIIKKDGNYTISIKQEISATNSQTKIKNSFIAEFSAKIKVTPKDDEKLGEIIDSLGKKMLNNNENASMLFSHIKDKRTIKYHVSYLISFRQCLLSVDCGKQLNNLHSISSLSDFNDESAFETIKSLMDSKNKFVRLLVARALLRIPHPNSLASLIQMQKDEEAKIRLSVVEGLGKTETAETTLLLQEMLKDVDSEVSKKAKELLDKRKIK